MAHQQQAERPGRGNKMATKSGTTREFKAKPTDPELLEGKDLEIKIIIEVNGKPVHVGFAQRKGVANPFNSGSVGWYAGGPISIEAVGHQLSLSIVQKGTKK